MHQEDRESSLTGVAPGWPPTSPEPFLDFAAWQSFGAVHVDFADDGRTVVVDTRDTVETWRTKWSGLISTRTSACAVRIVGRVRDRDHAVGRAGGFAIGLGELLPGDPVKAELAGSAVQFDFGMRGFRTAVYPADADHGVRPADLDNRWHDIEVVIDSGSHTHRRWFAGRADDCGWAVRSTFHPGVGGLHRVLRLHGHTVLSHRIRPNG